MVKLSAFVLSGIFAAAALPCHAAYEAYMQVKGMKRGAFKGAGRSKSDNIPILKYTMTLGSKPSITVVIEGVDGAEFSSALTNKETLASVVIRVTKPAKDGKVQLLETITLVQASVHSMSQTFDNNGAPLDTITFEYLQSRITQGTGQVVSADAWKLGPANPGR